LRFGGILRDEMIMKIAVVAPTYLPARRANTIQVMKMAQALTANGHTVNVSVPGEPAVSWEELAGQYGLAQPFSVTWLPVRSQLRRHDYGFSAVRWARGWGADLIYTRLPQAAAIASLQGMPVIHEIHDLPQGVLGPMLFRGFRAGRGARRLVLITYTLAEDLAEKFAIPVQTPFTLVAPDGVDLERYRQLPDQSEVRRKLRTEYSLPIQEDSFIAGYTGHLYAGRGVELMIELAQKTPEITYLLVGGEPSASTRLNEIVNERELINVVLTGFVPNTLVPFYQTACDVLLMPYQWHVAASSGGDIGRYLSPMKLFEYLAVGRTILSSDLPVLREVLTPENAVLLPPEDVEAWTGAIEELRHNPSRRVLLGEQARADSLHFTWEARAERIIAGV
jgi:glycosyltransferase involved in cell wall biosynthesis